MSVLQEIKQNYLFSNNAVRKIIFVNVLLFLVFEGIDVVCEYLLNTGFSSGSITRYLTLPASFGAFLYKPWSLVTYMFLHHGFFHILFNMLWLYWMGELLHEYLGNRRVYQSYFLGGIFGGLLFMIAYNVFPVFRNDIARAFALGASAGVLSVVASAATLLPEYEVRLFGVIRIRLKWLATFIVVIDFISINKDNPGGHIAHLGGALFGFLFIRQLRSTTILDRIAGRFSSLFRSSGKMKIHYRKAGSGREESRKPSQQEIDTILDKINRSGYDSLTRQEKDLLYKASKD